MFGTSLGYLNFIFSLSNDLSRSTNRVETYQLKGSPKILAMKGTIEEKHSDTIGEESKHIYTIVVMTETGLLSLQCDAAS